MIVRHEQQHNETMLQALHHAEAGVYSPRARPLPAPPFQSGRAGHGERGGRRVRDGSGRRGFAYDNERPRHARELPTFEIDRLPVTNAEFARFVESGGYRRREWWSDAGWALAGVRGHRAAALLDRGRRAARAFDRTAPLDPRLPVMPHLVVRGRRVRPLDRQAPAHRGRVGEGRRLGPGDGRAAPLPVGRRAGRATPRQPRPDRVRAGAGRGYPAGASPCGALGMLGDAWEWTASDFRGYPGFEAFPYREYSEIFFGSDVQGSARRFLGNPARRGQHDLPQLGLPAAPPDLLPASGARRDLRDRSPAEPSRSTPTSTARRSTRWPTRSATAWGAS